jgi:hypothetical protein
MSSFFRGYAQRTAKSARWNPNPWMQKRNFGGSDEPEAARGALLDLKKNLGDDVGFFFRMANIAKFFPAVQFQSRASPSYPYCHC